MSQSSLYPVATRVLPLGGITDCQGPCTLPPVLGLLAEDQDRQTNLSAIPETPAALVMSESQQVAADVNGLEAGQGVS